MTEILKAACVQMTSGPDIDENLKQAEGFIREAAAQGARFIVTPENTDFLRSSLRKSLETAPSEDNHQGVPFFANLAKELGVWILAGSFKVKLERKMANRGFLFSPDGEVTARYDKMHLFDVDLPTGESYKESTEVEGGTQAVVADIGGAKLGLSICYDLRFAYLYRDLAKQDAQILAIPSAFTIPTGEAHWSVLQRARAIETGCFVVSAAQCGEHEGGRKTYGHSIIVGPWGEVLAEADDKPGIITADLDLSLIEKARTAVPSLKHDREYSF